jgi:hypothetical protein
MVWGIVWTRRKGKLGGIWPWFNVVRLNLNFKDEYKKIQVLSSGASCIKK